MPDALPDHSAARAQNCARVEPVWHIQHTVGNKSHVNVVPHALFNRAADEMVEAVRDCVKAEAEAERLRTRLRAVYEIAANYGIGSSEALRRIRALALDDSDLPKET